MVYSGTALPVAVIDLDHIEAGLQLRTVLLEPEARRRRKAALLILIDILHRPCKRGAFSRLDLDEQHVFPALRDEVYLAEAGAIPFVLN